MSFVSEVGWLREWRCDVTPLAVTLPGAETPRLPAWIGAACNARGEGVHHVS